MRSDYWKLHDPQVIEKTGHPLAHWAGVLDHFEASNKKSNDVVAHLQHEHKVPKYWARSLTTWYAARRTAANASAKAKAKK